MRSSAGPPHLLEDLRLGQVRVRVTDRGEHLVLAVDVPVEQRHGCHGFGRFVHEQTLDEIGGLVAGPGEVLGPRAAAVGPVDACEKRRDHLAQLVEHELRVRLGFRQRVRAHA
jgi:hypothetical protein